MKYLLILAIGAFLVIHYTNQVDASSSLLTIFTNQTRGAFGVPFLKETPELNELAKNKCQDMQLRNYVTHTINDESLSKFYPIESSENLSEGLLSDEAITQYFNSTPESVSNIINKKFTQTGVAHCNDKIQYLTVQVFN